MAALREGMARLAGGPTPRLDSELLLARARGCARAALLADFERELAPDELAAYRISLERRAAGEPVAYLVGSQEFMSLTFAVTPAVLIPRPDTEILVEEACRRVGDRAAAVADCGVGSGAMAVALAHHRPRVRVYATDCSAEALAVARANARRHGVEGRVSFHRGDHLAPLLAGGLTGFDGVLANPPYIPTAGLAHLPAGVRCYEPLLALDGGADGLASYRVLAAQAPRLLAPGGWLGVEVGPGQATAVAALLGAAGWGRTLILPDLAGRPRAVFAAIGP